MSLVPEVFIGCSVEGIPVAKAFQSHFDHQRDIRVYVWTDRSFSLSKSTLTSLVSITRKHSYSVFVLTPDDHTSKRAEHLPSPRDNVVFELGLFLGRNGPASTF